VAGKDFEGAEIAFVGKDVHHIPISVNKPG
jgi:hypothetical protein